MYLSEVFNGNRCQSGRRNIHILIIARGAADELCFRLLISRSRFKQSKNSMLKTSSVIGCFVNFWLIFGYIWVEIVFLKGLERFKEITKIKDLMKFKN